MPSWKKVAEEAIDQEFLKMARVDCTTAENKAICSKYNVKGFPTILYGNIDELETYEGGRDEQSLRGFVQGLKAPCSANHDNCSAGEIAVLTELAELSTTELEGRIRHYDENTTKIEVQFENDVKALQERYQQLTNQKAKDISRLRRESHVSLIKTTLGSRSE